ncbi:MAG: NGG1p interacting factor NIF3 [Candidatus Omnitrophica bacterium]|nr:NGG1p interacting factor NIF3 [Candidatus Omnitrophota bacterium]
MKLSRFYKSVIKFGSQCDPRLKKKSIKSYADTAILYGKPDAEIKKILVGIDIEVGELLLADRIRSKQGLDLVISHHPEGRAYALLYEVMQLQVDLLKQAGLSQAVAEKLLEERKAEVERKVLSQNHNRAVDAARILNLPFICMHTPADNQVYFFLKQLFAKKKPKTVKDIIDILLKIPEYQEAARNMAGPRIFLGSLKNPVGKILFEMTGGTEGPKDAFDKLYRAGVRTLVSMHLSEEHLKKVKDASLNVVIAGHISSDTLGLNLLLDKIEKIEKLEVIGCSGFKRIKRI